MNALKDFALLLLISVVGIIGIVGAVWDPLK